MILQSWSQNSCSSLNPEVRFYILLYLSIWFCNLGFTHILSFLVSFRSSLSRVCRRIAALKIFEKFPEKHLWWSLYSLKLYYKYLLCWLKYLFLVSATSLSLCTFLSVIFSDTFFYHGNMAWFPSKMFCHSNFIFIQIFGGLVFLNRFMLKLRCQFIYINSHNI